MATTLAQYRTKVRNILEDWPRHDALNDATGVNTTDTTFTVDDGTKFHADEYIQIEDECCLVTAVSTNDLTVVRAEKGTTAATHADNAVIYINPLYLNIDINSYINECHTSILEKKVYDDFSLFSQSKVLSHFESTETWTGGSADTSKFRTGQQGLRITSSGTAVEPYRTGTFDLKGLDSDTFDFFCYVDDVTYLSSIVVKFHQTTDTKVFSYTVGTLVDGWNDVSIDRDDFTNTGSADWRQIVRIEFEVTSTGSTPVNVVIDSLRLRTNQENVYVYDLPSTLTKLLKVYVYKNDHKARRPFRRYSINKDFGTGSVNQLQTHIPISSGYKIGLSYIANFTTLSTDATETTLPTRAQELPVYWACYRLLAAKTAPRARYDRASTQLNEEANPPWLPNQTAENWLKTFERERIRAGMAKSYASYKQIEDY